MLDLLLMAVTHSAVSGEANNDAALGIERELGVHGLDDGSVLELGS